MAGIIEPSIYCEAIANDEDILYEGSEDEYYKSSTVRKERYETAGQRFLNSQNTLLVSSTLRGPFDARYGWSSPWRSRTQLLQKTSNTTPKQSLPPALLSEKRIPDNLECYLPSPESLTKTSGAISHNYLERNELEVVQKWRHDVGQASGGPNPGRKRRAKGSEWLKRRDSKRQKCSIPDSQSNTPTRRRKSAEKSKTKIHVRTSAVPSTPAQRKTPLAAKSASRCQGTKQGAVVNNHDELVDSLDASSKSASQSLVSPVKRISPIRQFSRSMQACGNEEDSADELSNQKAAATLSSPVSQRKVNLNPDIQVSKSISFPKTRKIEPSDRKTRSMRSKKGIPAALVDTASTEMLKQPSSKILASGSAQRIIAAQSTEVMIDNDNNDDDALSSSSLSSVHERSSQLVADLDEYSPLALLLNKHREAEKESSADEEISMSKSTSPISPEGDNHSGDNLNIYRNSAAFRDDHDNKTFATTPAADDDDVASISSLSSARDDSSTLGADIDTTTPLGLMIHGLGKQEISAADSKTPGNDEADENRVEHDDQQTISQSPDSWHSFGDDELEKEMADPTEVPAVSLDKDRSHPLTSSKNSEESQSSSSASAHDALTTEKQLDSATHETNSEMSSPPPNDIVGSEHDHCETATSEGVNNDQGTELGQKQAPSGSILPSESFNIKRVLQQLVQRRPWLSLGSTGSEQDSQSKTTDDGVGSGKDCAPDEVHCDEGMVNTSRSFDAHRNDNEQESELASADPNQHDSSTSTVECINPDNEHPPTAPRKGLQELADASLNRLHRSPVDRSIRKRTPRRITPEPQFCVKPFASFMSPSPVRPKARRMVAPQQVASRAHVLSELGKKKTVTWAPLPKNGDEHDAADKARTLRAASPPPDASMEDLPMAEDDKFRNHFSAVVNRTGDRQPKTTTLQSDIVDPYEVPEALEPTEPKLSKTTRTETEMRDSQPTSDSLSDIFDEMDGVLSTWNIEAELDDARRAEHSGLMELDTF